MNYEVDVAVHFWFDGNNHLHKAYNLLYPNPMIWPWKPLIWKLCILPKHRLALLENSSTACLG